MISKIKKNKIINNKIKKKTKIIEKKLNLCNETQEILKHIIPNTILSKYNQHIQSLVNQFTSDNNNKSILDKLFSIKQYNLSTNAHIKIVNKHSSKDFILDDTTKIPNFIAIFQHLLTLQSFTNYLTSPELSNLQNIFSLPDKHQIYKELHLYKHTTLFNKLIKLYNQEFYNIIPELKSKFPSIAFHDLLINGFTSFKILEDIENNMNTLSISSLEYKPSYPLSHPQKTNKLLSDNLLYIFSNGIHTVSQINTLSQQIIQRLLFFNTFLNTEKLPRKLIIFLTNQEKEIDDMLEHTHHFRTININTAVTNGRDIIIYREQELLKSVFHELIHFHTMDFRAFPSIKVENTILAYLKKTHNIYEHNEYLLYECITEALANILNNIYSSETKNITDFQNNLSNEIIFSTFQVCKILKLCKYTSWEQFTLLNGNTHNRTKQFKQDSCVFSYYILKLYILLNINEYWNTILDKHLKFNPTPENFYKLIAIFEKGRKDKQLATIINSILKNLSQKSKKYSSISKNNKLKNNTAGKSNISKTLRMTCIN